MREVNLRKAKSTAGGGSRFPFVGLGFITAASELTIVDETSGSYREKS